MSDYFGDGQLIEWKDWYTEERVNSMQRVIDDAHAEALCGPEVGGHADPFVRLRRVALILGKHQLWCG